MGNENCFKCNKKSVKVSIALLNRDLHVKEEHVTRIYPNQAPAVLVECLKCEICGHSFIPKTICLKEISSEEIAKNRNSSEPYLI